MFVPKDLKLPEKPEGASESWKPVLPLASSATYITQFLAQISTTLDNNLVAYTWALQHNTTSNLLIPIKPILGLRTSLTMEPGKAVHLTKAN